MNLAFRAYVCSPALAEGRIVSLFLSVEKSGRLAMFNEDWMLLSREMNHRVRHELAEADSRRLVRLVKGQSGTALYWRFRWMMCGVGLRLVSLGARIEARFLPPAQRAENRAR